ncbi:hypothetical protein GF322_00880 [Candidatus Dependentiae bacterium]|nr:hypothetical protein [Candidatus Dependentiae bacterium]
MKNSILIIVFSLFFLNKIYTNPFSKITIVSKKAICRGDKKQPKRFIFTYIDDVNVTFADGSKIKSEELEIELDITNVRNDFDKKNQNIKSDDEKNEKNKQKMHEDFSHLKRVVFRKNVFIQSTNRIVRSDMAELFFREKKCKLLGNVKIEQVKNNPKDIPILTQCEQAVFNMDKDEIIFLGTQNQPVNTVIKIAGRPGLFKKIKTKKEKALEAKLLANKRSISIG